MEIILGESHTHNPKIVKTVSVDIPRKDQPVEHRPSTPAKVDYRFRSSPLAISSQEELSPLSLSALRPFEPLPHLLQLSQQNQQFVADAPTPSPKSAKTSCGKIKTPDGFDKIKKRAPDTQGPSRKRDQDDTDLDEDEDTPSVGRRARKSTKLKETKLQPPRVPTLWH
jgi:hypothetical protein